MADTVLENRLSELNCDPLELSAQIAAGKPVQTIHPDFPKIKKQWNKLLQALADGKISVTALEDFWSLLETTLKTTLPSMELRSKHIVSLNEYIYSKKKSVESTNKVEHFETPEQLPDSVLEALLRGEDVNIDLRSEDDASQSAT